METLLETLQISFFMHNDFLAESRDIITKNKDIHTLKHPLNTQFLACNHFLLHFINKMRYHLCPLTLPLNLSFQHPTIDIILDAFGSTGLQFFKP